MKVERIFIPVSVDERNPISPTKYPEVYVCVIEGKEFLEKRLFYASDIWENEDGKVTHWLEERQGVIVFTPEELEELLAYVGCAKDWFTYNAR